MSAPAAGGPTELWLVENGTLTTDALSAAQVARLRAEFGRAVVVRPSWQAGAVELAAHDLIGVIAFGGDAAGGLRLHIQPKTPLANLFFMLTYAYELPDFRGAESPLATADDLFAFLVDIFVKRVDRLVRDGIARGYVESDDDPAFLRGRLRPMEHLRRSATRPGRFPQQLNEFTADLPENRILKFTLWRLARAGPGDDALRRRLRRTLSAFSEVSLAAVTPADCERVVYTRLNESYRTPVNLARLFLQHLSLEGHAGGTPFMSYLLPMAKVFEAFAGRYLRESYRGHPRLRVELQRPIALDEEARVAGRPDIVLYRNGQPWAILDTKYKLFDDAPNDTDRNQMYAYCGAMGVRRAVLVYADAAPVDYVVRLRGGAGPVTLAAQSLALDGALAEFQARCADWAASVGLAHDSPPPAPA